jgi:2-aminoadipate transaminase
MFLWIILPKKINTNLLLQKAIAKKVAYVAGDAFYHDGGNYNSMRLNFSYSDDTQIAEGIKRLGIVIKDELIKSYNGEPFLQEGV